MSDIFTRYGDHFENMRERQVQSRREQPAAEGMSFSRMREEQSAASMEDLRARNARAQELRQKYGFNYTTEQYSVIANMLDKEIINEDQAFDLLSAQMISDNFKRLGIDVEPREVLQNLPVYNEYIQGRAPGQSARTPKGNLAAIRDSFIIADSNFKSNFLNWQLAGARSSGNKGLENVIQQRLAHERETVEMYGDYQKRNFFVEAGKFAAESSLYTAFVIGGGMLGGIPGAFAAGWAGATGQAYGGLDAAGVKHEIALPFAIAMGAVNAVIETQLGNAAGLVGRATGAKTLQQSIAKRAAAFVSDKLHLSGTALKMATGPAARYVLESAGEMSEEVFQEIADIIGTELAAFIQKEGVTLEREDYIGRIAQAGKAGFMASLFMGIPGLAIDTVGSAGSYKALRTDADTIPSEEMFKKLHKDNPLRGNMDEKEWDSELSKIHKGRQDIRLQDEARIAQELKNNAGLGEGYAEKRDNPATGESEFVVPGTDEKIPLGETFYNKKGLLHSELDLKNGLFKIGDPRVDKSKYNLYSHIRFKEDEDGTVHITDFHVRPDMDTPDFRYKAYERFAENFAGKNIVNDNENLRGIEADLVKRNPYSTGLNYYPDSIAAEKADTQAKGDTAESARMKLRFGEQMAAHVTGSTESSRAGLVRLIDRIGRSYGLTFDKFINKLGLDPENIFTNEPGRAVIEENKKRAAQFESGTQEVRGALQPWRKLDADMKAVEYSIVYLKPQSADFSTVLHELKHAVDNFLEKYDEDLFKKMMDAAGDYTAENSGGVDEMTWRRERSAYAFERYMQTGEAPNAELRGLFRQMKEWLKDILKYLNDMRKLTAAQKEVFDELLSKTDKVEADWDAAQEAAQKAPQSTRKAHDAPEAAKAGNDGADDGSKRETGDGKEGVSGIPAIRERYRAADKEYGDEDVFNISGEEVTVRYVIMEAAVPTASHDEVTFNETEGFPTIGGKNANTRAYKKDIEAQKAVIETGLDYDSRALDELPVITTDGVVINGARRTMGSKLAARNDADGKYLKSFPRKAKRAGFKEEQWARFKHPRLLMEIEINGDYSADLFHSFNQDGRKADDPVEEAVRMTMLIKDSTVRAVADIIAAHDSIDELYKDKKALLEIFNIIKTSKLIGDYEMPKYFTEHGGISGAGEDLLENALLGATLSEDNIRVLSKSKALRRKLARALPQLVENRAMGGYSVIPEVNEAVRIAAEVEQNSKTFKNVEEWAAQKGFDFMEQKNQTAVELAKQLEGNQSGFSYFMGGLNAVLAEEARGQSDMFGGTSKEELLRRYLGIKAQIDEIRAANNEVIESAAATTQEKVEAALENAGLAKAEAEGALFQRAFHGSPYRFERFDSSHMGSGEGAQAYGWGLYFAGKKDVAEYYRKKLSNASFNFYIDGEKVNSDDVTRYFFILCAAEAGKLNDQIKLLEVSLDEKYQDEKSKRINKENVIKAKELIGKNVERRGGQLYEVDIPGDEDMLDRDKLFVEQPEGLRSILQNVINEFVLPELGNPDFNDPHFNLPGTVTGAYIYNTLKSKLGSAKAASQHLNSLGIKGIRYLDSSSRGKGEGSYNYVIFDDSEINITQTYFQIIGEKGAAAMDRAEESTHRLDNLNIARQMEEAKKDAKAIRLATGWERGADGKWRYEIPDVKIIDAGRKKTYEDDTYYPSLGELVIADDLFRAYPEIKNYKVIKTEGQETGSFNSKTKEIKIDQYNFQYKTRSSLEKILSHEILHAVQDIEGFASGSNVNYWEKQKIGKFHKSINRLNKEMDKIIESLSSREKRIYREYRDRVRNIENNRSHPENIALSSLDFQEVLERIDNEAIDEFQIPEEKEKFKIFISLLADRNYQVRNNELLDPYKLYWRTAGEVESRNAENRRGMTPTQRMETLLSETEDVSREDQIFIRDGMQIAQMAEREEIRAQEKQNYTEKLNEYKKGKLNPDTLITVTSAPDAYVRHGIQDFKLRMQGRVIKKATEKHNVKMETIENLYELINSPVLLMNSISESAAPHAFITLIDAVDKNGAPVIVTQNPTNREITSITSVYGKDNLDNLVRRTHEKGKIIAVDKNKATKYLRPQELQLLQDSVFDDLSTVSSNPSQLSSESKTLFQTQAYNPDNDPVLFQLDSELVKEAAGCDNWREFRDGIDTVQMSTAADNAWYRSVWSDAQKIYGETLFQDEEDTSRAGELDNRFYREADKKYLTETLKELYRIHANESLEPAQEESEAVREDYKRIKRLQRRINTELPNAGSIIGIAAQVRSGMGLSSTQYDRIKTWMRKNKRDYRSIFADIMEQEEFLEDMAETNDGEPSGRLANPLAEKQNVKARLKEIANIIRETDPALAREIEDEVISWDDPRIKAFEKGTEAENKKAKEAMEKYEEETARDYAKLVNDIQRRIVDAYDRMIKAREQLEFEDEKLAKMMKEEKEIAGPYLKKQRQEKANYDQALKAYEDLISMYGKDAQVREAVARREARADERKKQKGIMQRQKAAKVFREIRQKLIKRIMRKISFETVNYDQAEIGKAIQRLFEVSVYEGVNKWIGPEDRKSLREIFWQWSTDEEFRENLIKQMQQRYKKSKDRGESKIRQIENILNKSWDKITVNDKKSLFKLLPETNLIKELGIVELSYDNRESLQLDIEERLIDGEIKVFLGHELKRKVTGALGEELYSRIQNKPLSEWTLGEAGELARVIDRLTVEGKRELAAKKEARRVLEQQYRDKVLAALENTGIVINPDDTPEEKEKKKQKQNDILKKFAKGRKNTLFNNFFDANLRRFTTAMDGGRKGIFTSLLYWNENDAYNEEQKQIAARRLLIDNVMEKNHITLAELYKEVKIAGLEDADIYRTKGGRITVDDLLYIMRGYQNEETRNAIMYGNLSNASERSRSARSAEDLEGFTNVAHGRMMLVMSYAKEFFAKEENKKFMSLYEAIGKDYDSNGDRLNRAMIDMFNKPMWRVENYVPMHRQEATGDENENRIIEDMLGITGAGQKWVNRGFTEKRINIKPGGQRPIELGLYKTWADSVNSTEHLLAYGPRVQTLNAVFKGFHSAEVRQVMRDRWGASAVNRVAETIAEFATLDPKRQRSALDNVVRSLRGKTATAYLAWKTSAVLKQLATSPWPYLQEIPPHQYIAACIEVAAGFGKVNKEIREKSAYMRNREFDPMLKLVKEAQEKNINAGRAGIDKFNNVGMEGLKWVDWICVAPGWLAVYKKELANVAKEQETKFQKLLGEYQGSEYSDVLPTPESKTNRALSEVLNEEMQEAEAVARADDAVRRMQPSSRLTDMSPLFKGRSETANMLLQFTMSLNVIWQNIWYDLPLAVREKQVWTVLGMVTGYALAGICLGLLTDDDDDDDERAAARRVLFYSFTQFTDAVPVIGDGVTRALEIGITGKTKYSGKQNFLPVVEKALGGAGSLVGAFWEEDPEKRDKRFKKAAASMGEAAGIYFGGPVSGAKELGALAGIGDGDGEFELYLQALMGRRK